MDDFLLEHTLHGLQKQINTERQSNQDYFQVNDTMWVGADQRIGDLELRADSNDTVVSELIDLVTTISNDLKQTKDELLQARTVNLKQEIVIRTMHNMTILSADDMFVDTFADGDYIDWDRSARAGLLISAPQSIGVTEESHIEVSQESVRGNLLISKNGSSDEGIRQVFTVDKTRDIDKIELYLEKASSSTYQSLRINLVRIDTETTMANYLIPASNITSGWKVVDLPRLRLEENVEYAIEILTDDVYGYKVGFEPSDVYLPGTSQSLYSDSWTENGFDLSFRVWCYIAEDEENCQVYTFEKILPTKPELLVFEIDDTTIGQPIQYFASVDGVDWFQIQSKQTYDVSARNGNKIILRADIVGESRINAWGYVVKRSAS